MTLDHRPSPELLSVLQALPGLDLEGGALERTEIDLETAPPGARAEFIPLLERPPLSAGVLLATGPPGARITFLDHGHPGGEESFQLSGRTLGEAEPGDFWHLDPGERHRPVGEFDAAGRYLVLLVWPGGTVA